MTASIFSAPKARFDALDRSAGLAFAGNVLLRDAEHRAEDCIEQALATEGVLAFAFCGNRVILKQDGTVVDPLFAPYELGELDPDYDNAILLGHRPGGEPRLAVPVRASEDGLAAHHKLYDARSVFRDGLVTGEVLGELAQAASLVAWNATTRFCGLCGARMAIKSGGYKRECTACEKPAFPRTDPVVIMLTLHPDTDHCLLGRSPHFPPGMYSCLAGFVEPGETLEDSVRRETFEESGLRIGPVTYHASQPWPMPHSLMIGCRASAITTDIHRDEQELEDCRWFSREEVARILAGEHPEGIAAPHPGTIARLLIEDWIAHPGAG